MAQSEYCPYSSIWNKSSEIALSKPEKTRLQVTGASDSLPETVL